MTMKKKLVCLILILTLCVSLFSGCVLFDKDNAKDYAQVVATIGNVPIGQNADGTTKFFEKKITKRDLVIAYLNYGQQQAQQNGMDAEAAFKWTLDQLIAKELIIARYTRLENSGELQAAYSKITGYDADENPIYDRTEFEVNKVKDFNKAWKAVYQYCDNYISSEETRLYTLAGKTAPAKGQAAGDPTYPLNTLITKSAKDAQEELDKLTPEKPFAPDPANIPKAADSIRLDAVKNFIIYVIQQVSDISLNADEEAALKADKAFINKIENKTEIYKHIMGDANGEGGFFCIRKLIAESQFDQVKYERMQDYYNKQVDVAEEEVNRYYKNTLETQTKQFSKSNANYKETYFNALKDTSANPFVFYHPTSDVFYVKHILLPFSDAQKAQITAYGSGRTAQDQKNFQNQMANQITAYPHLNGFDDTSKGALGIRQIADEITSVMAPYKNANPENREWAFNGLIQKYNTDPGAFNNELGYIMPPKDSGISSGFMSEFEDGAYKLWDEYNVGDVLPEYAITSYGVHIMYLSSATQEGTRTLWDFTSPMKLQTYGQAVKDFLLNKKQTENFTYMQKQIVNEYTKTGTAYVTIYEKRFSDLYKNR